MKSRGKWLFAGVILAIVLAGTLAALLVVRIGPQLAMSTNFYGAEFDPPRRIGDFKLARLDGSTISESDLDGRLSLFFFGYTYCPDVCPMTLAEVGNARKLLGNDAASIDSYFVTVDPERDNPARMKEYLQNFDRGIVGLIPASDADLQRVKATFGVLSERRPVASGGYTVDHSAGVFFIDQDRRLRLMFAIGLEPEQIVSDIRRVQREATAAAVSRPTSRPDSAAPAQQASATIQISSPWVRAATKQLGQTAAYLVIKNVGSTPDTLTGASCQAADLTEIHQSAMENGMMRMRPAGPVAIPAGGEVKLQQGGLHVMMTGLREDLVAESTITIVLKFERAGEIPFSAPVRPAASSGGGM